MNAAFLEREVERVVRHDVFSANAADLVLRLQVEDGQRAEIALTDGRGRALGGRTLVAEECGELKQALVLALSLMLDVSAEDVDALHEQAGSSPSVPPGATPQTTDSAAADASDRKPEPVSGADTAAPATSVREQAPSRASSSDTPVGVAAGVMGRAALGVVPNPAVGAGIFAGLGRAGSYYAVLDAVYLLTPRFEREGGTVAWRLLDLGASFCPFGLSGAAGELWACARGAAGYALAEGDGFATTQSASAWLVQAGAEAHWVHTLGKLRLEATGTISTPLLGYRITLAAEGGSRVIFTSNELIGTFGVGLGWLFH